MSSLLAADTGEELSRLGVVSRRHGILKGFVILTPKHLALTWGWVLVFKGTSNMIWTHSFVILQMLIIFLKRKLAHHFLRPGIKEHQSSPESEDLPWVFLGGWLRFQMTIGWIAGRFYNHVALRPWWCEVVGFFDGMFQSCHLTFADVFFGKCGEFKMAVCQKIGGFSATMNHFQVTLGVGNFETCRHTQVKFEVQKFH